jgi:tetratricopeptide (TPR) repeat protein
MAASRKKINIIFALISVALGCKAVITVINKVDQVVLTSDRNGSGLENNLPADHPPVDVANRLADLLQRSEKDPQNADIDSDIGNVYYDLGEYEKAVDYYRKSLDLRPNQPNVETDMAACLYYLGQYDTALKLLDNVLQYSPGFAQALYNKGIVLIHGKNDPENGIKIWEKLLQSDLDPAKREELQQSIQQLRSSIR